MIPNVGALSSGIELSNGHLLDFIGDGIGIRIGVDGTNFATNSNGERLNLSVATNGDDNLIGTATPDTIARERTGATTVVAPLIAVQREVEGGDGLLGTDGERATIKTQGTRPHAVGRIGR